MIKAMLINKYLGQEFLKITIKTTLIFFALGFVMNLFEEINFFKDLNVKAYTPIILSLLFTPSLLHDFFPFIILISGILFFLKIKETYELTAINVSGVSNVSVIVIPSILSVLIGVFLITAINPITSILVKKYEIKKGAYEVDQEYLGAITENGIWVREKNMEKNNIIRSSYLKDQNLIDVSIYEFDQNNDFVRRIEAKTADISSLKWNLKGVKIINSEGIVSSNTKENITFISMYDIDKIKDLYSNLDTISFWDLNREIKLLKQRGYSTKQMKAKMHRSFAFPFFLLSMLLLSSFFTLGTAFNENNTTYAFLTITSSIVIFFFNDFSAVLGETEKLPLEISVWMPILIIFIFSFIGIIHANQK